MPLTRALALAAQRNLHAVHSMGYIHGDLDLSNFVVVEGSEPTSPLVKVIDFGMARPADCSQVQEEKHELIHMFTGEVSNLNFFEAKDKTPFKLPVSLLGGGCDVALADRMKSRQHGWGQM